MNFEGVSKIVFIISLAILSSLMIFSLTWRNIEKSIEHNKCIKQAYKPEFCEIKKGD